MKLRRNSIIKHLLCSIGRFFARIPNCTRWRLLADEEIKQHHLIIYECEICGYIHLIDYRKEYLGVYD